MDPQSVNSCLRKIRDQSHGLSYIDADALAKSMGRRLARNREFDAYFSKTTAPQLTLGNNALSETFVAYPAPNQPFGDSIDRLDDGTKIRYHLDTRLFRGEKNIAVWFDGADIHPDKDSMLVVPRTDMRPHLLFPQACGDFAFSQENGIPFDDGMEKIPGYPGTRSLVRDMAGAWFGPAIRSDSRINTPGNNMDQVVYLVFRLSSKCGVFLTDERADIPSFQHPSL